MSRLLKKARELQIVDITINYWNNDNKQLQEEIRRMFNVSNVVITKTLTDEAETLREIGKAAARELDTYLGDDMTLGISWGRHVKMTANYLERHSYSNMHVVELFGAISYDMNQTDMLSIGINISSKLNGEFHPLPSPIYIKGPIAWKAIMETPQIQSTLQKIKKCDLILTGVGGVDDISSEKIWDTYVEADMKKQIIRKGGVGFILARFFNRTGEFLDVEANKYVVGIETHTVKAKKIFAVASGKGKAKSILAALRGGLISTLVSDEETLKLVMKMELQE